MHCPACCLHQLRSRQGTPRHSLATMGPFLAQSTASLLCPSSEEVFKGKLSVRQDNRKPRANTILQVLSLLKITSLWTEVSHTAARTVPGQREIPGWRAQGLRPELGTGHPRSIPAPHIVSKATKSDPEHQARSTPCALQGVQQQGAPCPSQSTALDLTALPERTPMTSEG